VEPGDHQSVDLSIGGIGILAAELRATNRFAESAQLERRSQTRRQDIWGVGHGVIVTNSGAVGAVLPRTGRARRPTLPIAAVASLTVLGRAATAHPFY
jgi:hypothetical protein